MALLTQALVWLHREECGESAVLATPLPLHAAQLTGVHPTWLGDYNLSCIPTMPLQCALLLHGQSTRLTWMVVLSGCDNQPN